MSNTLTSLIPSAYAALDTISREMIGALPAVRRDASVERAAVNQAVLVFNTRAAASSNITPGVTPPNDGDQTLDNVSVTITKAKRVPFRWNGEEERGLDNGGAGAEAIKGDQIEQAFRTLANEMEADVIEAARVGASRAYGTSGTAPFATTLEDAAQIRKIFDDNGAPKGGRSLIIDSNAALNLRKQTQLTKANEAGTTMTLRDGELLDLFGFSVKESAGAAPVAIGTGASYTSNTAGYAIGATDITLITGTGTVLAGDYVTFAGDANKYLVKTGLAAPGVLVLAAPGLRKALAASAVAMTVGAAYTANVAFHQSAMILAVRAPALPKNGDLAQDRVTITDARSGISFEIAMYPQYRQMQYEVSAAWGVKNIKSQHSAVLLG